MSLTEGQMIGPYVASRPLGAGRFGQVWLARHCDLGVERAIKISIDPVYGRHLRNEARAQFQLDHPNIVRTFDVNTLHDPPYLVMEYVPGGDLRQHLRTRKKLRLGNTLELVKQVLRALEASHAAGLIHGDLKPENILLDSATRAKITDFGVGQLNVDSIESIRISTSLARGNPLIGTLDYMSNEQRRGAAPDAMDDLYAAGVLACELMTGALPGGALARLCEREGLGEHVHRFLEKALDGRDYRFASATEMLQAVETLESPELGIAVEPKLLELPPFLQPPPSLPVTQPSGRGFASETGITLVEIPAGEFMQGEDPAERKSRSRQETGDMVMRYDARPHLVRITRPFFMATCPVTQAQWNRMMWRNPSHFSGPLMPVDQVCWHDAMRFCERLSRAEGRRYRLPTEAEWEYACRAGTVGAFNNGAKVDPDELAWHQGNSEGQTHPLGQKRPNPWGLFDMHGNVWEWCMDQFEDYPDHAMDDPCFTGLVPDAPRILRGGCWSRTAWECRSSVRYWLQPGLTGPGIGLRVVCEDM